MGMRENKVETYFKDQIKLIGGISRKWVSPGRDGVPDQIAIIDGAVFFVEVKTSDGELSTAQTREHQRLRENGATVCTVYGHKGVGLLIDDVRLFLRPLTRFYR